MKDSYLIKSVSGGRCGYVYFPKELIGNRIKIKVLSNETKP